MSSFAFRLHRFILPLSAILIITLLSSSTSAELLRASTTSSTNTGTSTISTTTHNVGVGVGVGDHVSMTKEAADLRSQHLSKKKPILQQSVSITSLLFPGSEPYEYKVNEYIPMFVDYVESRKTPVGVDYYQLPVCAQPTNIMDSILNNKNENNEDTNSNNNGNGDGGIEMIHKMKKKNLGQRLMGHSTKPLGYKIPSKINQSCNILCHVSLNSKQLKLMRKLVKKQYRVHFTLDGLPVLVRSTDYNHALRGYPLGFALPLSTGVELEPETTNRNVVEGHNGHENEEIYLNNHLKFTIYYNDHTTTLNDDKIHITGFDVATVSINHAAPKDGSWFMLDSMTDTVPTLDTCGGMNSEPVQNKKDTLLALRTDAAGGDLDVVYSYEVEWKASEVEWPDRWDVYMMETPDNEVHYFAIVNSLMIGFLLCGTVAIIMIRALKKDITRYNEFDIDDYNTPVEESGWKLVHGDVFRPPKKGRTLLSVAVGTGLQIGTSLFFTFIAAVLRLLNPMKKGQMLSFVIISYVLSGSVAGYCSARLFKFFSGKHWKRTTFLTAAAFPAVLLTLFLTLNIGLYLSLGKVSVSVSFSTILIAFLLWIFVSSPLVFVGGVFGYRSDKIDVPTKTHQIARFVPESRSWFVKFPHCALLAGLLPFGSVCIELSFIMGALWLHQIYYIMGFVTIVCMILTISCSTVSMVFCYIQLCNEDYKWWWKSFFNCASIGLYLFLYSLWYLVTKLDLVGLWPFMVYSTYMGIISFACALYCGGVGVISSFWFVRKIYGAVKVD
mmetsp:Transcript_6523/g.8268  ORF Transcript_6523/g.8268 Transcript_6523/m.8268 type:complete len:780 (+) Transcript_6523:228-2567(+)